MGWANSRPRRAGEPPHAPGDRRMQSMTIRTFLYGFVVSALASGAGLAQTAEFPSATVKILVPFAAGGPTDVVARILADLLSVRWGGKSVMIENRPGAGTIVATAAVAKAPPDGHTLLIGTNSLLINPAL